jgi:hypothetical protein
VTLSLSRLGALRFLGDRKRAQRRSDRQPRACWRCRGGAALVRSAGRRSCSQPARSAMKDHGFSTTAVGNAVSSRRWEAAGPREPGAVAVAEPDGVPAAVAVAVLAGPGGVSDLVRGTLADPQRTTGWRSWAVAGRHCSLSLDLKRPRSCLSSSPSWSRSFCRPFWARRDCLSCRREEKPRPRPASSMFSPSMATAPTAAP